MLPRLTTFEIIIIIAMLVLSKNHDHHVEHRLSDIYLILVNVYSFLGMVAPDGRCKSFDASADGYSRGEGAGVIVLKPFDRALADNDRIYAVIRGGALTNDGHTPGIANPSYNAQVELVRRACVNAAVAYADIPYVEAHGTGTQGRRHDRGECSRSDDRYSTKEPRHSSVHRFGEVQHLPLRELGWDCRSDQDRPWRSNTVKSRMSFISGAATRRSSLTSTT